VIILLLLAAAALGWAMFRAPFPTASTVEAYPILWLEIILFVVLALDSFSKPRAPVWAALIAGTAVGTHVAAVTLIPAIAVLLVYRARNVPKAVSALIAFLGPVVFSYCVLPTLWPGHERSESTGSIVQSVSEMLVAHRGRWTWLGYQLNQWSLIAPVSLGFALIGAMTAKLSRRESGPLVFLGAMAAGLSLPILVLNPSSSRGPLADWDEHARRHWGSSGDRWSWSPGNAWPSKCDRS